MRSDKADRSSRSFLARGSRILRRQGSKINIVATLDEEDELERMPRHRGRQADHRKWGIFELLLEAIACRWRYEFLD